MIETTIDVVGQQRLAEFINKIGEVLNNKCRRASFATYALGLLGDSERKSMEPIAARDCADPHHADAAHQRLQHFITSSTWSDRDVRRIAVQYGLAAVKTWDPVRAWIIDDTGFLKKGYHSVGVQRQYTGSAGKVTNCQIGVNLTIATNTRHLPIDFELYLPKCWTDDPDRRREAQIPAEIQFRTKPQLALEMLQRAVEDDLPRGIVLGDTAYGNACWFRTAVRDLGLDYALSVQADTKVWQLDSLLRRRGSPLSIRELMQELASQKGKKGFRRITWREGTKTKLSARFAVRRVVPYHDGCWSETDAHSPPFNWLFHSNIDGHVLEPGRHRGERQWQARANPAPIGHFVVGSELSGSPACHPPNSFLKA